MHFRCISASKLPVQCLYMGWAAILSRVGPVLPGTGFTVSMPGTGFHNSVPPSIKNMEKGWISEYDFTICISKMFSFSCISLIPMHTANILEYQGNGLISVSVYFLKLILCFPNDFKYMYV